MKPWWEALLPLGRPGSRTVVCDPDSPALAIELGRRGYRLLVLHDGSFDVPGLRRKLRELGLSSQLMGAQVYKNGQSLGLVVDFYELWIFCATPRMLGEAAKALRRGAPIYWQAKLSSQVAPDGAEPLLGLPDGVRGVTFPGRPL